MKILVIGDSHVASLKRAYDNLSREMEDIKLFFVASKGGGLSSVKVRKGVLCSDDNSVLKNIEYTFGSARVDINNLDLDAILLYGMHLAVPFSFARSIINGVYSEQFLEESFNDFLIQKWGFRLAIDVASNTSVRTYIASPFPSREGLPIQEFSSDLYARKLEAISFFQERFLSDLNLNYYLQPTETFSPNCKTFTDYSIGSKRLDVGNKFDDEEHPTNDYIHMNDLFGEIFIKSFIKDQKKAAGQAAQGLAGS